MRAYSDSSRPESVARRAGVARWVLAIIFAAFAARLVQLQVVQHSQYADLARDNVLREEVVPAIRGVMTDRRGRILVDSVPSYTLAFDPFDRAFLHGCSMDSTLGALAVIAGLSASEIGVRVEREKHRSYRPVRLKRRLDFATVSYIEERREQFPGVVIEVEPMRRQVYPALAPHTLGYVGEVSESEVGRHPGGRVYRSSDLIGRTGVERALEEVLCGHNGRRMVGVNALGRRTDQLFNLTSFGDLEPPSHGHAVRLSIDLDVQRAVDAAFPDSMAGAVVVLDVRDGGVLTIISRPTYDANEFSAGLSSERWQELFSDPRHPLHDRALTSAYPPGSVFKVVTAVAALRGGHIGLRERLTVCNGGMQFGNRWFGCHAKHGSLTFADAMVRSCDVYFYQLGLRVGLDALAEAARDLGFGEPAGIELDEKGGLVPDARWYDNRYGKRGWTRGHLLNLAIGQGEILATPLQLATAMATVARGGRRVTPYVVRSVGGRDRRPQSAPEEGSLDPQVLGTVSAALEKVVSGQRGTGGAARVRGIRVAGKTGTAQNPHGEDHAIFAGFAPVDDPRIAFAVVVENGGHGGTAAAPVARQVVRACLEEHADLWTIDDDVAATEPEGGGPLKVSSRGVE